MERKDKCKVAYTRLLVDTISKNGMPQLCLQVDQGLLDLVVEDDVSTPKNMFVNAVLSCYFVVLFWVFKQESKKQHNNKTKKNEFAKCFFAFFVFCCVFCIISASINITLLRKSAGVV